MRSRILSGCLLCLCAACRPEAGEAVRAAAIAETAQPRDASAATDTACESTSGVLGFAHLLYDSATVIRFYAEPDSTAAPVTTLRFHPTEHDVSFHVAGEPQPQLRPELHKLDYGVFDLHVLARRDGWLRVDVGGGRALWTREGASARFDDWLASMQESFSIEPKDWARNHLRTAAGDDARAVTPAPAPFAETENPFRVDSMDGNWVLLEQLDLFNPLPGPPARGWVRWRDEAGCLSVWIYRLS